MPPYNDETENKMNIVNIMKFVRGCEPRFDIDLVLPIKKELELCRKYCFANTFLFRYDALVRENMVSIVKARRTPRSVSGLRWRSA